MLYPKNLEIKLGFDFIKDQIRNNCISLIGQERVDKMKFSSQYDHINLWLNQCWEFVGIFNRGDVFPSSNYHGLDAYAKKAAIRGAYLLGEEFLKIKQSLETILFCIQYFSENKKECPSLFQLIEPLNLDKSVVALIDAIIDKEGNVKDNASSDLMEIRVGLRKEYRNLRKNLEHIFKKAANDGFVPDGTSITIRDGRLVIPVAAEYKRRIKGFIHDESSTGQTVFIEPAEVLEGNNKIRELELLEKREIVKILTVLTDRIRPYTEAFLSTSFYLSLIDFIRAKAKVAIQYNCVLPTVLNENAIEWYEAVHPILYSLHSKANKPVVPLDMVLSKENRLLLISGPNAGGKSVCLKTVGLLQYMLQCGVLVPVREDSKFGVFKDMFIDIGDEQSIENDLSTYSSHLNNMKHFTKFSGPSSLLLIDEFGTGTDPQFGGAIAEAVLENVVENKSWGVITTHYSNLKHFADANQGIINGAMRYNVEAMEPLYQLEIGKPGSSFALEIARKIGLNHNILKKAKTLAGVSHTDIDQLLLKLEREKSKSIELNKKLKQQENKLKQSTARYDVLNTELKADKKAIINKAKEEAERLLNSTNKTIEQTIRTIKESKADKNKTKIAREQVEVLKKKVKPEKRIQDPMRTVSSEPQIGDQIVILDQQVIGTLVGFTGKDCAVEIGDLKTKVKRSRIAKLAQQNKPNPTKKPSSKGVDLNQRRAQYSTTLDVRGKRAEEILPILQGYLDDALMFGIDEIRILHGKGNGVLRGLIRNFLKNEPYVQRAEDEHVERGGQGITVVQLK